MKKSRAEAGKLGQIAASATQQRMKSERIEKYLLQPSSCGNCEAIIAYEKRWNKYCSKSCSAQVNNIGKIRNPNGGFLQPGKGGVLRGTPITWSTCHCGTAFRHKGRYCSIGCSAKYRKDQLLQQWLSGNIPGHCGKTAQIKGFVRRWMLAQANNSCSECGWNKRHPVDGLPLVEVDHIDGDATNSVPENLRVLCPNCHSETPNFRARNKTSTRKR